MKSEWIRKRTAKATVCWVLSLGMVASTPQLAMIQAYAAEMEQGGAEQQEETVVSATLVGDFSGLKFTNPKNGITNWTPADTNADLSYVGDGIYARTFTFEKTQEDVTIQYKVAFEHAWDHGEFGDGSDNLKLTIPAGATSLTVVCDKGNR